MALDVLEKLRGRVGQIAGLVDEANYRIKDRSSRRSSRSSSKLHDTIADALVDQLFMITEHVRIQIIEALSVLAVGNVGDKALETLDNVSESALDAVKELVAKIDEVFDIVDRFVDLGEKLTLTDVFVEKPVKVGTKILNRLLSSIDNIIGALGNRR
jgi:hypothetical protein